MTSDARFEASAHDLPEGDYVSPGLDLVMPDRCFPNMVRGDAAAHPWPYLRREVPHAWYVDRRFALMGFVNRDEAAILYNTARRFAGHRALEVGCWRGWSTCHLGLGGVSLDVVDPGLAEADTRAEIDAMLACAGLADRVRLHAGYSPAAVTALGEGGQGPWSLFFVDGDHEGNAPVRDVEACLPYAAPDAAFLFHDLASPDVALALRELEARGFSILLYQTMQIMGVAWRGDVGPVRHVPDPRVPWQLPHHLVGLPVSGVAFDGGITGLRQRIADQAQELARCRAQLSRTEEAVRRASLRSRLRRRLGLER